MDDNSGRAAPRAVSFSSLAFEPRFEHGDVAKVAVVTGSADEGELGTGFVRMENAVIPWTVKYDEVLLVVDGEVTIETAGGSLLAKAKDSIWLPKDTELIYRAEHALLFYAIHPWNWAEATT